MPKAFPIRIGGACFDLIDTEYELLNVGSGTELRVRMKYRLSTAFNWYTGGQSPSSSSAISRKRRFAFTPGALR